MAKAYYFFHFLLFFLTLFSQTTSTNEDPLDFTKMFNDKGYQKAHAIDVDGQEVISDMNGGFSYVYSLPSLKLSEQSSLNIKMTYASNIGVCVTNYALPTNNDLFVSKHHHRGGGKYVEDNMPGWILSVNGVPVQVLNFEDRIVSKLDPSVKEYSSGKNISYLINGYHYTLLNNTVGGDKIPKIELLRGDGGLDTYIYPKYNYTDDEPYFINRSTGGYSDVVKYVNRRIYVTRPSGEQIVYKHHLLNISKDLELNQLVYDPEKVNHHPSTFIPEKIVTSDDIVITFQYDASGTSLYPKLTGILTSTDNNLAVEHGVVDGQGRISVQNPVGSGKYTFYYTQENQENFNGFRMIGSITDPLYTVHQSEIKFDYYTDYTTSIYTGISGDEHKQARTFEVKKNPLSTIHYKTTSSNLNYKKLDYRTKAPDGLFNINDTSGRNLETQVLLDYITHKQKDGSVIKKVAYQFSASDYADRPSVGYTKLKTVKTTSYGPARINDEPQDGLETPKTIVETFQYEKKIRNLNRELLMGLKDIQNVLLSYEKKVNGKDFYKEVNTYNPDRLYKESSIKKSYAEDGSSVESKTEIKKSFFNNGLLNQIADIPTTDTLITKAGTTDTLITGKKINVYNVDYINKLNTSKHVHIPDYYKAGLVSSKTTYINDHLKSSSTYIYGTYPVNIIQHQDIKRTLKDSNKTVYSTEKNYHVYKSWKELAAMELGTSIQTDVPFRMEDDAFQAYIKKKTLKDETVDTYILIEKDQSVDYVDLYMKATSLGNSPTLKLIETSTSTEHTIGSLAHVNTTSTPKADPTKIRVNISTYPIGSTLKLYVTSGNFWVQDVQYTHQSIEFNTIAKSALNYPNINLTKVQDGYISHSQPLYSYSTFFGTTNIHLIDGVTVYHSSDKSALPKYSLNVSGLKTTFEHKNEYNFSALKRITSANTTLTTSERLLSGSPRLISRVKKELPNGNEKEFTTLYHSKNYLPIASINHYQHIAEATYDALGRIKEYTTPGMFKKPNSSTTQTISGATKSSFNFTNKFNRYTNDDSKPKNSTTYSLNQDAFNIRNSGFYRKLSDGTEKYEVITNTVYTQEKITSLFNVGSNVQSISNFSFKLNINFANITFTNFSTPVTAQISVYHITENGNRTFVSSFSKTLSNNSNTSASNTFNVSNQISMNDYFQIEFAITDIPKGNVETGNEFDASLSVDFDPELTHINATGFFDWASYSSHYSYDDAKNIVTKDDLVYPEHHRSIESRYFFNDLKKLKEVETYKRDNTARSLYRENKFFYRTDGSSLSIKDANGNQTTTLFNSLNQEIGTEYSSDQSKTTSTYVFIPKEEFEKIDFHFSKNDTSKLLKYNYLNLANVTTIKKTTHTDENGIKNERYSDNLGRTLVTVNDVDSIKQTIFNIYDTKNQLIKVIHPNTKSTLYVYDDLGRVSKKVLPAKETTKYIYDYLGRVRYSQDSVQSKSNTVLFNNYDLAGRLIRSGYISDSWSRLKANYENKTESIKSINEIDSNAYIINYYSTLPGLPTDSASGVTSTYGLGQLVATKSRGSKKQPFQIEYYQYNDLGLQTKYSRWDTNGWFKEVYSYNNRQQLVEKQLSFLSKEIKYNYDYDWFGRNVNTYITYNKGIKKQLSSKSYTIMDQVSADQIANGLQTINYTYNGRGWLTYINNPASIGTDKFALKLNYSEPENSIFLKNGNISSIESYITKFARPYIKTNFVYDRLNRLKSSTDPANQFNSHYNYDIMGNIKSITRNGLLQE